MSKILIILLITLSSSFSNVKLGIDVFVDNKFDKIKNKKVALLTNYSGRDSKGVSTIINLSNSNLFDLKKVLVPEHGYYSAVPAGEHIENEKINGIDVISLYGKIRRPSKEILNDIDVVVIDIQDIGVRSYTYISTVYNVLDACAEYGKKVIILDRPNPLGGLVVDGNLVDSGKENFVSLIPVSYIHGMTIGELCLYINGEGLLKNNRHCDLEIIKMLNWKRSDTWDDLDLQWFPTSPHIPTIDAIRGNTSLGMIGELGLISIGIGTTLPFQYIGRPDFNFNEFETTIKKLFPDVTINEDFIIIDEVILTKTKYYPFYGMYNKKYCDGYLLNYTHNSEIKPFTAGMKILVTLFEMNPKLIDNLSPKAIEMFKKVTGTDVLWNNLINHKYSEIFSKIERERNIFILKRNKYLLY